ncbi:DUF6705 family protein [Bergeyella porcorum]
MKQILLMASILVSNAYRAQSTISLEQAYEYFKMTDGIPETVTYVKDVNNRLNQFVGTWAGSYGGKNYRFEFVKKLRFGNYSVKWDKLIGRVLITNNGNVIYNSFDVTDDNKTYLWGHTIQKRLYVLSFVANSYCNDSGDVFIEIDKSNPNKMYLHFDRDKGIYNPEKCPNYETYVPLLPKEKMVLIKQ